MPNLPTKVYVVQLYVYKLRARSESHKIFGNLKPLSLNAFLKNLWSINFFSCWYLGEYSIYFFMRRRFRSFVE